MAIVTGEYAAPQPPEDAPEPPALPAGGKTRPPYALLKAEARLRSYRWVFFALVLVNLHGGSTGLFYIASDWSRFVGLPSMGTYAFGQYFSISGPWLVGLGVSLHLCSLPVNVAAFWALARPAFASRMVLVIAGLLHLLTFASQALSISEMLLAGRNAAILLMNLPMYYLIGANILTVLSAGSNRQVFSETSRRYFSQPAAPRAAESYLPVGAFLLIFAVHQILQSFAILGGT